MLVQLRRNESNHGTQRVPWLSSGICVLAVILYVFGVSAFEALVMDKLFIAQGEWGRLLYGHFVHFKADHLFWDVVALIILGGIIERNNPKDFLPAFLFSCMGVSLWFLIFASCSAYCGLSGALNGLLVVAAVRLWQSSGNKSFLIAIVLTIAKTIYELVTKQTLFTDINAQAVPAAHAAGLIAGGVYIGISIIKQNWFFIQNFNVYNETH